MPWSSLTGMKAPESPPTYEDAITPPFFTWSLSRARAAVVPGAPGCSRPMHLRMSATESPMAGVGASERSMMPNGTPRRAEASCATSCPTRVILNAVFLMVSQSTSKLASPPPACLSICSRAYFTTPGPDTPTLMMASASLTPWKAPAMNGLSSGALQRTTSLAQPSESCSLVMSAVCSMMSPMRRTASMLIPVLVEPTLMDEHRRSVSAMACGMERMSSSSLFVMPLETMAE